MKCPNTLGHTDRISAGSAAEIKTACSVPQPIPGENPEVLLEMPHSLGVGEQALVEPRPLIAKSGDGLDVPIVNQFAHSLTRRPDVLSGRERGTNGREAAGVASGLVRWASSRFRSSRRAYSNNGNT